MLACAPGEQHTLGLIAFGVALHQVGWRITYLGADTPVPMVGQVADALEPDVVVVVAALQGRLSGHLEELRDLAGRWPVALAGAGVNDALADECGARHLALDPVGAAASLAA